MADGKVVIEIDLDSFKVESGLSKLKGIAGKAAKGIAVGVGAIGTALVGAVSKSVQMAGELEQQIGGTEAVFGNLASTVQDKAVKAFNTMGLSANDFMQTANKMGSLMQGAGLSVKNSMSLSTQAMQRAADVASVMGISTESAMESIAGAAKGNFTMMDNLGVAMNATTIEAYAMSKGIKTSYSEMDNATKVGLAMEMFLEKTSKYAGNYAKENETFAGSFSTLKAAISNFMSGAGSITDVTNAMVSFGEIVTNSIVEMAPQIVTGLTTLVQNLIPQIPPLLSQLLPIVLEGAMSLINSLVEIFPALLSLIKENLPTIVQGGIAIVKTLITTILDMLPMILEMGIQLLLELVKGIIEAIPDLIPAIIQCVQTMLSTLISFLPDIIMAGLDLLMALIFGIVDNINELIDAVLYLMGELIATLLRPDMLTKIIMAGIELIIALVVGLIKAIPNLIAATPKIIAAIVDTFRNMNWGKIGKDILKGIINGFLDIGNIIMNAVKKVGNSMMGAIKKFFGIHSPSTVMRDEVGRYLAQGLGVGFEDEMSSVYDDMQNAIDLEQGKMEANLQTGGIYNKVYGSTPIEVNNNNTTTLEADGEVLARVVNNVNNKRNLQYAF